MWGTNKDKFSTMGDLADNIPPKYPHPYTTDTVWDKSGNRTIMCYFVTMHFLDS